MVDEERFKTRLARLEQDLAELDRIGAPTAEQLAADLKARWAAERGLHVVIEGLLDLGAHVLSSEFKIQTSTYREIADEMVARGVVRGAAARELPRIASFRNILVHEYVKMDLDILAEILRGGIAHLAAAVRDLGRRAWESSRDDD